MSFDGSASTDADGSIASHAWDFGDGQAASGTTASHLYSVPGSYAVTLTVTDDGGGTATATASIQVAAPPPPNQPPTASLAVGPLSGDAPLTVSFDGSASTDPDGSIVSQAWDFGDGQATSGPTASHLYSVPGSYAVTLTVTDDGGGTATATASIQVAAPPPPNQPPTASLSAAPLSGDAPLTVSFDGSALTDADGSIVSHAWDFGDGQAASGPTASHLYSVPGSYAVTLTVTDDGGGTATATGASLVWH